MIDVQETYQENGIGLEAWSLDQESRRIQLDARAELWRVDGTISPSQIAVRLMIIWAHQKRS